MVRRLIFEDGKNTTKVNDRAAKGPPSEAVRLIHRFRAREACVVHVELGYVGLPLACRLADAGFRIVGLDIDNEKIAALAKGERYPSTVPRYRVAEARSRRFTASTDNSLARKADAVIICVPTPLTPAREPDLRYMIETLESLLPYLHEGQLLSLKSTSYSGTTDEIVRRESSRKGCASGNNFSSCSRPGAKILAMSGIQPARFRKCAVAPRRRASRWEPRCTDRQSIRWCR